MTNNQEITDRFRAAMAGAGMAIHGPIIADGRLQRVYVEGDKAGTQNGAYILQLGSYPLGYFEHFPSGLKQQWSPNGEPAPLPPGMCRQIEKFRKVRQWERKKRQRVAARKSRHIWERSSPIEARRDFSRKLKWDPSDFSGEK